ncbi:flagellar biosynthesis protein FliQ [Candidatus Phycosocius spiralis]|uniref:Flagellar biosynthetic protein FliQ n=1 Tax=Candidatus Phycosocius spiralis TaxID=2815099 RepID=A0ABQ4PVD2_9PROT|nr:flagellar biosynthesis protein FliQ [Candidatus Phycosocius spiralis]GIU66943.1 flagellar biosynthesis protein FliQ [Candidatus Phycosocius spiralis]
MNPPEVLDVARDAIWLTIAMSAPVMLVGLAVGLVIGLLQALTQIQEQTLVFVPKILAIFAAFLLFLPLMGGMMGEFMTQMMAKVAASGLN